MHRCTRVFVTLTAVTALAFGSGSAVAAPKESGDYCGGQCSDILPPGENGNATLADILGNKLFGTRPAHTDDQLAAYGNLAGDYQGLTNSTIENYFNDASFGVPQDKVASVQRPRADVTITRDKARGIPHIKGTTREGTEYGAGYAAGQDRLWLMDLFRHVGRGELSSFAGGAAANRQLEQTFWAAAPYTEKDLQRQVDTIANSGPDGKRALGDINAYLDGINAYAAKAHKQRNFPGEYDLTGHIDPITNAGTIKPFKATDLVAIASVVGALFGSGGGGEVTSALVKQAAEQRYGRERGDAVWRSFREENDPEANLTVHDGQKFPYSASPANPEGVAMPDPGSVQPQQEIYDPTGSAVEKPEAAAQRASTDAKTRAETRGSGDRNAAKGIFDRGVLPGNLLSAKHGMSNALVVNGKHTDDGHPIAVFGPQTGYFAPQLLMLEELDGPGIHSRGAAFAGVSFYVELGRGENYSWSATSASQDVTDTFAMRLCEPDGSPVTKESDHYLDGDRCVPMERLERADSWKPTIADSTPEGSYKLVMYRTKYGLVTHRATIGGKPVAYASQRSSYLHEADSIIGFGKFNDPAQMRTPQDFQRAAAKVNYTFNWFYANDQHTAYYNSGDNPDRPSTVDPNLPITAEKRYEWRGWNPEANTSQTTGFASHPQSIDQDYYISWNNKPAAEYTSPGFGDGSVYRSNLLEDRVRALVHGGRPISRADLVKAMADASVTDLRGEDVLPKLLKVIDSAPVTDPALRETVEKLRRWQRDGAKRVETKKSSQVYANADAIRIMDAWWPLLTTAEFKDGMGAPLFSAMTSALQLNESPSGGQAGEKHGSAGANEDQPHKGSAFQFGWWSYVDKDLRAVLGEPVSGPLAQKYCGSGDLAGCRKTLLDTLAKAAAQSPEEVYPGDEDCKAGQQWCADSIIHRPMGGVTDGKITWQNRPTYQQVVQFTGHP
ncbi:penicillin acylase family protein [Sciscionella sp. SE31]|uniref:penicillin acylase family protein n=1 Tax=Sciscionella sediminilitoris TaxID=1445613 RepID=UPI0004DEE942